MTADERFVVAMMLGKWYGIFYLVWISTPITSVAHEQAMAKMEALQQIAQSELGWTTEQLQKQAQVEIAGGE